MCGRTSATRQRLIGPKILVARTESGPAKSCEYKDSRRTRVAIFCFLSFEALRSFLSWSNCRTVSFADTVLWAIEGDKNSLSHTRERANRRAQLCPRTHRAHSEKIRGNGSVRSCGCILKRMVLSLEGRIVGRAYRANKTQHGDIINLEVAQSLNETCGKSVDIHHTLGDFSVVLSNDESNHQAQSWSQYTLRACMVIHVSQYHTEPSNTSDNSK